MRYLVPGHGEYVAVVGCSDPLLESHRQRVEMFARYLAQMGLTANFSPLLYENAAASERAAVLMSMYCDSKVRAIFDVSGGDVAHEVLDYLDMDLIAKNPKPIWGYSDLTCVINGVYQATGQRQVLYQTMNLERDFSGVQARRFQRLMQGDYDLFQPQWAMRQGTSLSGTVVGGNLRCLLKLSGTRLMPNMDGKVLFLESRSGGQERIISMVSQLKQMDVIEGLSGLLLGTFTELDQTMGRRDSIEMIVECIGRPDLPIAVTDHVGHAVTSKGIVIGGEINI